MDAELSQSYALALRRNVTQHRYLRPTCLGTAGVSNHMPLSLRGLGAF